MFSLRNSCHGFERDGLDLRRRSVEAPLFQHEKACPSTVYSVAALSLFADLSLQDLELAFPTLADRWFRPDQILDGQQSFHPLDHTMLSTDWFFLSGHFRRSGRKAKGHDPAIRDADASSNETLLCPAAAVRQNRLFQAVLRGR